MLRVVGARSLDALIDEIIPSDIRLAKPLALPEPETEFRYHQRLREIAATNRVFRSYIGLGYHDTIIPAVIQRNVFGTRAGTHPTRRIRLKSRRAASNRCSISRRWWAI